MGQIRVLVVDDSALARELITAVISSDKEIKVIGEASNGQEAIEKVHTLKPDVVTMDIEMPVMGGLEAIERIMASYAVPILVVTDHKEAKMAYAAIAKGALDLVAKPDVGLSGAKEFTDKIRLLSKIHVITHIRGKNQASEKNNFFHCASGKDASQKVVAIAASTGGPEALSVILSRLPEDFPCPVVIAQHISDGFISGMVEWFMKIVKVQVKVAEEGEVLLPGTVYISPSENHMKISSAKSIQFVPRQDNDIYHPSCDILLSSAAEVYGPQAIGLILTGMGRDGVQGMEQIRKAGGVTLAQDMQSSIVFGMPKAAIEQGCIDMVLPLEAINAKLINLMANGKKFDGTPRG